MRLTITPSGGRGAPASRALTIACSSTKPARARSASMPLFPRPRQTVLAETGGNETLQQDVRKRADPLRAELQAVELVALEHVLDVREPEGPVVGIVPVA